MFALTNSCSFAPHCLYCLHKLWKLFCNEFCTSYFGLYLIWHIKIGALHTLIEYSGANSGDLEESKLVNDEDQQDDNGEDNKYDEHGYD